MASCLRNIYLGDPLTNLDANGGAETKADSVARLPNPPKHLIEAVAATEVTVDGIRCMIYQPREISASGCTMIYMHGGGFVIGSSEDVDYTARKLCFANRMLVISLNYRLSPEFTFPAALDDCLTVANASADIATKLGATAAAPLFLAGDSAGGNLALSLAYSLLLAGQDVSGVVAFAPWLDMHLENYDSYNRLAPDGIVFDSPFMGYARAAYTRYEQWQDPMVSPILIPLASLPPTIVICGTADPLIDQALELRHRNSSEGKFELVTYDGMPHCFYSFPDLFAEEEDCYKRISAFIKDRMSGQ
jgi:acetyl esterase